MREILFKAKRKGTDEWVEGSLFVLDWESDYVYIMQKHTSASTLPLSLLIERCMVFVDKNTICQYTGMTDKNGDRIWENDIIEDLRFKKIMFGLKKVIFHEPSSGWCTESLKTDGRFMMLKHLTYYFVKRGNIFDNPELLKGEQNEINRQNSKRDWRRKRIHT